MGKIPKRITAWMPCVEGAGLAAPVAPLQHAFRMSTLGYRMCGCIHTGFCKDNPLHSKGAFFQVTWIRGGSPSLKQ